MEQAGFQPTRWEVLASAGATALMTLSAAAQWAPNIAALRSVIGRLRQESWMVRVILALPSWAWIVATLLLGGALFWLGLRTSRRWGALMLFLAPVAMLLVQLGIPWLILAPIRAATAGVPAKF